ncbi:diacylglycerol kinase family lipid kinase [Flavobacteriaceae bacterium S356]|uniref:Diacylglycerol kinase family lipid kinase n=1 Tax=Asprobacillus argus TaxID=3076534 RepID=A0ABU3LDT0_9FLAO|nr:diacylglycerol kinase family lipid kinase [Flavobacteriaceae bacterium S356]
MSHLDESSVTSSYFLIVNPSSGGGHFDKKWMKIQQLLNVYQIDYSFSFSEYSKHEIQLVDNAIKQGFRKIISVGGDGTLHYVVNGIMQQRYTKTSNIKVGVIPIGTGNDWIKTYTIPNDIESAIKIIVQDQTILQDIGMMTLSDNSTYYFNNLAGIGYDGYVVHKLDTLKKLGSISYILSGLYGLLFYRKPQFRIHINEKVIETTCLMTLFGICKYSGGGMQMTKNADPQDGLLDITLAKDFKFFDLVFNLKKLYTGAIVHHKKVENYKATQLEIIDIHTKKPFIEADGELIGTGSVKVSIQPKAIHFIIKPVKG